ncbi:MAG TPA: LPS assembly protein LptD, partial [Candidatus Acidoferrum sp.]|nr:LPS assembly protein LptD [Candidatus Acidoferrum sp.]
MPIASVSWSASPTRGIWSANIDSGLIFERDFDFGSEHYRQTLEPRLYYLYNQYKDQSKIPLFDTSQLTFSFNQLFRDDRFSG